MADGGKGRVTFSWQLPPWVRLELRVAVCRDGDTLVREIVSADGNFMRATYVVTEEGELVATESVRKQDEGDEAAVSHTWHCKRGE